jgi:hypothetical protein
LAGRSVPRWVFGDIIVVTLVAHPPNGFWVTSNCWEFPILLLAGGFALALIGLANGRLTARWA